MNPETPITLNVNLGEINGILTGLAQLPYGQVAALVAKVQGQAEAQAKPAEVPAENIEE
jgi:hypothetical protein